jgi:hypothetical protein
MGTEGHTPNIQGVHLLLGFLGLLVMRKSSLLGLHFYVLICFLPGCTFGLALTVDVAALDIV